MITELNINNLIGTINDSALLNLLKNQLDNISIGA